MHRLSVGDSALRTDPLASHAPLGLCELAGPEPACEPPPRAEPRERRTVTVIPLTLSLNFDPIFVEFWDPLFPVNAYDQAGATKGAPPSGGHSNLGRRRRCGRSAPLLPPNAVYRLRLERREGKRQGGEPSPP